MSLNFREGFRRTCVLWSALAGLLIVLGAIAAIANRTYLESLNYWNLKAPRYDSPQYKAYKALEDRIETAVKNRYLNVAEGNRLLDAAIRSGNYSYVPKRVITVPLVKAINWYGILWFVVIGLVVIAWPLAFYWPGVYVARGFTRDRREKRVGNDTYRFDRATLRALVLRVQAVPKNPYARLTLYAVIAPVIWILLREEIGPRLPASQRTIRLDRLPPMQQESQKSPPSVQLEQLSDQDLEAYSRRDLRAMSDHGLSILAGESPTQKTHQQYVAEYRDKIGISNTQVLYDVQKRDWLSAPEYLGPYLYVTVTNNGPVWLHDCRLQVGLEQNGYLVQKIFVDLPQGERIGPGQSKSYKLSLANQTLPQSWTAGEVSAYSWDISSLYP